MATAWVIGGGPAGLMAAGELAAAGARVIVAEAKPSIGRKFLMAGKSGLNLTKDEPPASFKHAYAESETWLAPMIDAFGPAEVRAWAEGLGVHLFIGSTGRVFPIGMKASPLLRAWLGRLGDGGVDLRTRWRWTGWEGSSLRFDTPVGPQVVNGDVTVLACGGASWSRLGSDGAWAPILKTVGVTPAPFAPSNAGVDLVWSPHMAPHLGQPLKGVSLTAGDQVSRGEVVLSGRGLEGGGIYPLSPVLRRGAPLLIDLVPNLTIDAVTGRLARPRGKASLSNHLRKTLGFSAAKGAVLNEFARPLPVDVTALAERIKALPVPYRGLRPLDEAISTAGGLRAVDLTGDLMLRDLPGVFAAGEMLDWEAPTGGYLLTACFATGRWAGRGAARYLGLTPVSPAPA